MQADDSGAPVSQGVRPKSDGPRTPSTPIWSSTPSWASRPAATLGRTNRVVTAIWSELIDLETTFLTRCVEHGSGDFQAGTRKSTTIKVD